MRGVSKSASRVAPLLAVFLVFTAAGAWAGETQTPPTDPPEARMKPPDGVTTQARMQPPVGVSLLDIIVTWLQSRLSVPNG